MYCEQCGTKLITDAKFCYQCGKRVEIIDENLDRETIQAIKECILSEPELMKAEDVMTIMKTSQRVVGPEITLEILGQHLPLSRDIAGLKVVRDYFNDYAERNVAKYIDYLESNVKNFDDIYDRAIPFSVNCIKAAIENAVEIAKNLGIFDMNYEWLSILMEEQWDSDALFDYYTQIAKVIENAAAKLASYRGIERANASQWHGGGFGIIGAIKGHVQATALNIGTNVIREIGNAVVDSKDKEKLRKAKEYLYKDSRMIENLIMITYNCSFMPYYVLLPIFEEANVVVADAERNAGDMKEAEAILIQYFEEKISKEKGVDTVLKLLQKHPFNPIYYIYIELLEEKSHSQVEQIVQNMGLKYVYKYERHASEVKYIEILNDVSNTSIGSIQSKMKLLSALEIYDVHNKNDLQNAKNVLREAWSKEIMLMPEYELDELCLKIKEYKSLQQEYGLDWKKQKKCLQDCERINVKYEDKVYLTCLKKNLLEIKPFIDKTNECVMAKNISEIWHQADMQNGYAQALLFEFYNKKMKLYMNSGKDLKNIQSIFPYLYKEINKGNTFALFIEASLENKIKIYKANKETNSEISNMQLRSARKEYMKYVVDKANNEEMVYAMYVLAHEILSQKNRFYYSRYCKSHEEMPLLSSGEIRVLIKRAADAFIPDAVNDLVMAYSQTYNGEVAEIRVDNEKRHKLLEIRDELRSQFPLLDLEKWYELNVDLPLTSTNVENIKCKICGSAIRIGKKFCSQCGTKVGDEG